MKRFGCLLFLVSLQLFNSCMPTSNKKSPTGLCIDFKEDTEHFTELERQLAIDIITRSDREIRKLLPKLPKDIKVIVEIVDWNIDVVGGVTGRTESNSPPLVMVQVSSKFPGGTVTAINAGLKSTIYHEFHHLTLGWAIKDNAFAPEIPVASVIEGFAVVFSETYTGAVFAENNYPDEVGNWVRELLELPKDANYQTWMFQHPDGRTSIGYKTGNYLVKQAMRNSGMTILELSDMAPYDIIKMAGH